MGVFEVQIKVRNWQNRFLLAPNPRSPEEPLLPLLLELVCKPRRTLITQGDKVLSSVDPKSTRSEDLTSPSFALHRAVEGPVKPGEGLRRACPERRRRVVGLWLALGLLAALSCTLLPPSRFSPPVTPTRRARATLTPTPTQAKLTPTLHPTPELAPADSDGDLFPDEAETAMGNDPFVNECLQQAGCSGPTVPTPSGILNVVIVLDASAGMAGEMLGSTRMDLAKAALSQYVETLPPSTNVGLLLYGHRGSRDKGGQAESCAAIELVYRVGPVDRTALKAMISSAPAVGWAPVAEALLAAQRALAGRERQTNRILLVASSGDSCGGDPCQVVKEMRQKGVTTTIDAIGFNLAYEAIQPLQCVANTTGGLYYSLSTIEELAEVWKALQWREKHWFETESCLAPNRDLYLSCRQSELGQFTEWAHSSGWIQDHRHQFAAITQALAAEQAAWSGSPTPLPTATP